MEDQGTRRWQGGEYMTVILPTLTQAGETWKWKNIQRLEIKYIELRSASDVQYGGES